MSFTLNNTYTMVFRWDGSSNNESMYIGKIIIQFSCLCKQICFTLHMCVWYLDVPCYIRTMTCTLYQIDPFPPLIFELTPPPPLAPSFVFNSMVLILDGSSENVAHIFKQVFFHYFSILPNAFNKSKCRNLLCMCS